MGLYRIWGFQLPDQSMSATWGSQTVAEHCLIEMDSPLEDIIDVQNALPAYDSGVTSEPTFTIGLSYHPERTDLILKEAPSVKEHTSGRPFWIVELRYETATWLDRTLPTENQGIGNVGRKKRISTTDFITYPWDEPPTWSGSTKQVKATVYQDSAGTKLVHANYLPLTEGIDVTIELEVHTFTWNVEYDMFTYADDIAPFVGKINDDDVFEADPKHVLLETCTAVENYRTQNIGVRDGQDGAGAIETHHFITITATFVIDRRTTEEGYFREANRRVSMHTMQLANAGNPIIPIWGFVPIDVNDRGDYAQSPWPLASLAYTTANGFNRGIGFPYDALPTADPETDFWIIDPLYPEEADLTQFVTNNGLIIP